MSTPWRFGAVVAPAIRPARDTPCTEPAPRHAGAIMGKLAAWIACCAIVAGACQRADRAVESPPATAGPPAQPPVHTGPPGGGASDDEVLVAAPVDATGDLDCFTPMHLVDIPQWAGLIATGDVDDDGRADILVNYDVPPPSGKGKKFGEYIAVFGGDGAGDFARGGTETLDTDFSYSMDLGDINGDGHADVVINSYRDKRVVVLAGLGDGTFEQKRSVDTSRKPGDVTLVDMNRDGYLDLVVTYFGHVRMFTGDGAFGFLGTRAVSVDQAPEAPGIADFDGDGHLDIAVVSNDVNTLTTLEGSAGDGTYRLVSQGSTCAGPTYLYAADLNGDGATDIAYPCRDGVVEVRTNDSRGGFTQSSLAAPNVEYLAGGDFSGDGAADLLAMGRPGTFNGSDLILFTNDGTGAFEQRSTHHVDGTLTNPVVTDVNGDGRPDVVAAYWPGREPGHLAVFTSTRCRDR